MTTLADFYKKAVNSVTILFSIFIHMKLIISIILLSFINICNNYAQNPQGAEIIENEYFLEEIEGNEIAKYHHDKDQNIYIASFTRNPETFFITKTDTLGNIIWHNTYPELIVPHENSALETYSLVIDRGNKEIVLGYESKITRIDFEGTLIKQYDVLESSYLVGSKNNIDYLVELGAEVVDTNDVLFFYYNINLLSFDNIVNSNTILHSIKKPSQGVLGFDIWMAEINIISSDDFFDFTVLMDQDPNLTANEAVRLASAFRFNWNGDLLLTADEYSTWNFFKPTLMKTIEFGYSSNKHIFGTGAGFYNNYENCIMSTDSDLLDGNYVFRESSRHFTELNSEVVLFTDKLFHCELLQNIAPLKDYNYKYKYGMEHRNIAYGIVNNHLYILRLLGEDLDQDGYYGLLDCDDSDNSINPGIQEILNNGIDDDCDSLSLDDYLTCYIPYLKFEHQLDLDSFNLLYNNCNVIIETDFDINNNLDLSSISNIVSVKGKLNISQELVSNAYTLPSIQFVNTLELKSTNVDSIKLDIKKINTCIINNNERLTSINVNDDMEIKNSLNIKNNSNFSYCSISPFCLAYSRGAHIEIQNNNFGCESLFQFSESCIIDADMDGYGIFQDCDDTNQNINPGSTEILNNDIDEDCDGIAQIDLDGDGFFDFEDCNDNNPFINPGAVEILNNNVDDDCNSYSSDSIQTCFIEDLYLFTTQDLNQFIDLYNDCNVVILGDFMIEIPNGPDIELKMITHILEKFYIDYASNASFAILQEIGGTVRVGNCSTLNMPSIKKIHDFDDSNLDYFNAAELKTIENIRIKDLLEIDFPSLNNVDNLEIFNSHLQTIKFNALRDVANFKIDRCSNLEFLILHDSLQISEDLRITNCEIFTECSILPLCNHISTGGSAYLSNNGFGCVSEIEMIFYCTDNDGDGFTVQEDCNDEDPGINPDAIEVPYDGIDNDCDISTLDDDLDQDGFNFSADCNDDDPDINPDAIEIPNNGIDEDCDGQDLISNLSGTEIFGYSIYPNPTSSELYISLSNQFQVNIEIFDIFKKRIFKQSHFSKNLTLDLSNFASGTYLLELNTKQNRIVKKIIVLSN